MPASSLYRSLLVLYPRDYRASFGAEMTAAFERESRERRAQGRTAYACFIAGELLRLAVGAVTEWFAKLTTDATVRGRGLPDLQKMRPAGVPRGLWFSTAGGSALQDGPTDEITAAEQRVEFCLRRMEHAIANHDFTGARFYSDEDLKAREALRRLRRKREIAE